MDLLKTKTKTGMRSEVTQIAVAEAAEIWGRSLRGFLGHAAEKSASPQATIAAAAGDAEGKGKQSLPLSLHAAVE
jgi:hypothetical protein